MHAQHAALHGDRLFSHATLEAEDVEAFVLTGSTFARLSPAEQPGVHAH